MQRSLIAKLLAVLWTVMLIVGGVRLAAAGQAETASLIVKVISGLSAAEESAVIARDGGT